MRTLHTFLAGLFICAVQQAAAADCLDLYGAALKTAGGHLAADVAPASPDGKAALRVTPGQGATDGLVLLPLGDFRDGEIRLKLRSALRPDASPDARGFAGLAFRVAPDAKTWRCQL